MTKQDTVRYEMFARVRDFGEKHRALFPESSVGGQAFAAVAAAVDQLSHNAVDKLSTAAEGKRTKTVTRQALDDRLVGLARTARAIAAKTPGFGVDAFRLPRPRTGPALVAAGRVFIRRAEAYKREFIAHGRPETFIADLTALVDAFERALRSREAGKSDQRAAKAGIAAAMASAQAALVTLDDVVANTFENDRVTLAVWKGDRRIGGTYKAKAVNVVPEPALAPAPAPAVTVTSPAGGPAAATANSQPGPVPAPALAVAS